jgi:hypothetical protein
VVYCTVIRHQASLDRLILALFLREEQKYQKRAAQPLFFGIFALKIKR